MRNAVVFLSLLSVITISFAEFKRPSEKVNGKTLDGWMYQIMRSGEREKRQAAMENLPAYGRASIPKLLQLLSHEGSDPGPRRRSAMALGYLGPLADDTIPQLKGRLDYPDDLLQKIVRESLNKIDPDWKSRETALAKPESDPPKPAPKPEPVPEPEPKPEIVMKPGPAPKPEPAPQPEPAEPQFYAELVATFEFEDSIFQWGTMAFDGDRILWYRDRKSYIAHLDLESSEIKQLEIPVTNSITSGLSPDGTQFLSSISADFSEKEEFDVFDTLTGKKVASLGGKLSGLKNPLSLYSVAISNSNYAIVANESIEVYDFVAKKSLAELKGVEIDYTPVFAANDKVILRNGRERSVWDWKADKLLRMPDCEGVSPSGKFYATVESGGFGEKATVTIKDVVRGEEVRSFQLGISSSPSSQYFFSSNDRIFGAVGNKDVEIWDLKNERKLGSFGHDGEFIQTGFLSTDGTKFVGISSKMLRVWQLGMK